MHQLFIEKSKHEKFKSFINYNQISGRIGIESSILKKHIIYGIWLSFYFIFRIFISSKSKPRMKQQNYKFSGNIWKSSFLTRNFIWGALKDVKNALYQLNDDILHSHAIFLNISEELNYKYGKFWKSWRDAWKLSEKWVSFA